MPKKTRATVIVIRRRAFGHTNYHYLVEDSGLLHLSLNGYATERAARLAAHIHLIKHASAQN